MKARAGARFFQLQIGYEPEVLERFVAQAEDVGLTDQRGADPVDHDPALGPRAALRRREGPGHPRFPRPIIERVEAAADQQQACFELAHELAAHALSLPGVAGLHLISFRKDAGIAQLCTQLGLEPRIEREKSLAYAHDSALTL